MDSMYYIGLDVHKKTISYCIKDASGQVHREGTGLTDDLYQSDSRVARKGGARQWRVFEALPWPDD